MLQTTANALWAALCLPESLAFRRSLHDVAGTQHRLLMRLLSRNADTIYGRRYGFARLGSVAAYQARVPLTTYDDYREAVERIGAGEHGVLTRDPVRLLEPTSGSTAPTKYIPYTATLKAEFGRAVAPWIVDLYSHDPHLLTGQAYWSVTPVTRHDERTPGGIPIGFEDDSQYFGRLQGGLIRTLLAVPPLVRLIDDMEVFRYVTLLFLLRSRSLALISVWNPTFLTLLVGRLPGSWTQLGTDIAHGTVSPPGTLAPELRAALSRIAHADRRRATEIRAAFEIGGEPGAIHRRLWPRLRLISCWTEAHAARHVPELEWLFPGVCLQGKGLLATEGAISFPRVGHVGAALAIRSHFFEFLPVDSAGREAGSDSPLLAHQLDTGGCYSVVMTTGGGLYRYRLDDLVEVTGHLGTCPLLRFLGKASHISDHFGEKVNEHHVRQILDQLLDRFAIRPTFAMVAFEAEAGRHAYTLFIEAQGQPDEIVRSLGAALEAALAANYHYRYCRELGQLDALRVFRVEEGALESYLAACQARGQRAGDVKPVALHHLEGWSHAFRGRMLSPLPGSRV